MGLTQYITAFITFVNNIVIPFLLGVAFLLFVINVFRYFILGGSNTDGQEKARSLATYGVLAFVLIIIFWGIVNLLTSSLGLSRLATSDNTCFDYDPLCNDGIDYDRSGPSGRASVIGQAGNPNPAGPGRRASTIPAPQDPGPGGRAIVTNGTQLLAAPGPRTRPIITKGTDVLADAGSGGREAIKNTPGKYQESIVNSLENTKPIAANYIADVDNDLIEIELQYIINNAALTNIERMAMLKSFNEAKIFGDGNFVVIADNLNDVYTQYDDERISLAEPGYAAYAEQLAQYGAAIRYDTEQSNRFAQSIGLNNQSELAVTVNDTYSASIPLETKIDNAYAKYQLYTGTQANADIREEYLDDFITATNIYIERTGENDGIPITRADILGN